MKYTDFADKIDEHFAAIQRMINELPCKTYEKKCTLNILLQGCISLNHRINNDCAEFLESE